MITVGFLSWNRRREEEPGDGSRDRAIAGNPAAVAERASELSRQLPSHQHCAPANRLKAASCSLDGATRSQDTLASRQAQWRQQNPGLLQAKVAEDSMGDRAPAGLSVLYRCVSKPR